MTRLVSEDIQPINSRLKRYDDELVKKTGRTLWGIACYSNGIDDEALLQGHLERVTVGVVPIKSGLGIIPGFSETVRQMIHHLGFHVFVTNQSDVAGIAEAVERRADILFMADDERFIALNIRKGIVVDNSECTARGFVAALDLMNNGINGANVLVLGCGPVGYQAVMEVLRRDGRVSVYDIDSKKSLRLKDRIGEVMRCTPAIEPTLAQALSNHDLIIEATNASGVIDEEHITCQTRVAAPGMPLGLTPRAVEKIGDRLVHDPLQIGVAVMAVNALTTI
ncbi:MAG: 3-methylornithyl-N6-L-lysine dehydrogenase PylD [Candidatus Omnitrophota bacterium]